MHQIRPLHPIHNRRIPLSLLLAIILPRTLGHIHKRRYPRSLVAIHNWHGSGSAVVRGAGIDGRGDVADGILLGLVSGVCVVGGEGGGAAADVEGSATIRGGGGSGGFRGEWRGGVA